MKSRKESKDEIKSAKIDAHCVSSNPYKIMFSVFVSYTNGKSEYLPPITKDELEEAMKKYEKYLDNQSKINVKGWLEYPDSYTNHARFWSNNNNKLILKAAAAATVAASCVFAYRYLKK